MKMLIHTVAAAFCAAVLATFFPGMATAGCGSGPNFQQVLAPDLNAIAAQSGPAHNSQPIVGMWKTVLTSRGTSVVPGPPLPPDTPFEWGYTQWHSDGTEFFNSGDRQPTSQNFCLGTWEQTGPLKYKLNHFAYNYDPITSVLIGKVNIREEVTVDRGGNRYCGTFAIDGWDTSGNQIIRIRGTLEAARVTVNTVDTSIP